MQFIHPSLTWGFLLVLIPLAIHLINLVRRRRIQWAAMDFLLQSYRKHRTWVWLQQLLLLLLRMGAIALLVAMLAQWVTQREWFAMLGGAATHHFVLIDDSYSMSESSSGGSAFTNAEQVFGDIVSQAMRQDTPQKLTLVRYSRAAAGSPGRTDGLTDASGEIIDSGYETRLAELRRQLEVTELAPAAKGALEVVKQLLADTEDENNVVYLLSDFRQQNWSNPEDERRLLADIADMDCVIHLIDCAAEPQANLTISSLQPADDTRAAGIPLFVDIRVSNNGQRVARKVPVQLRTYSFDPQVVAASRPGEDVARQDEPPAVLIEELAAGESVTVRSQVFFASPGPQVVEAYLPDDPVPADSRRWCVVDIPENETVLIIDGGVGQRNAYYLASAFAPGQRVATGVRPEIEQPSFLRDSSLDELRRFRAIYLLDVARLDSSAVEQLAQYVRGGGGVGVFLGEGIDVSFYNDEFYRDGEGLFPLPLERIAELPAERFENVPDLEVLDNPVFDVFLGERNPLVQWVRIEKYLRPPRDWTANPDVHVLTRLRNGDPLVIERRSGAGRLVAFVTTAAPDWNNWANDPSYVVTVLKLHSYLASPSRATENRLVGSPIRVELSLEKHHPTVAFVTSTATAGGQVIEQSVDADTDVGTATVVLERGAASARPSPTDRSGVYEAWLSTLTGLSEVQRFALNVDPTEGALAKLPSRTLIDNLAPVKVDFHEAGDYAVNFMESAGANRSLLLMVLLVAALLGEQVLAYFTSFHPRSGGVV